MKIAYLILCHKEPEQVNYLLHALCHEDNYLFVHVDTKSRIKDKISSMGRIFVLDECIDIKWGQISMVKATLLLFNMVIKSGIQFDYVWLISGQDFPIKSNEYIHNYLDVNKGYNFISAVETSSALKFSKRHTIYFPL